MKERLKQFIKENHLIASGDHVCVGLSGGADSVCLFLLLNELQAEMDFTLSAFHTDHHLRGEDSDRDRQFVKELCERAQIPLKIYDHDVNKTAAEMKIGTEEAGRILRKQDAYDCIANGATKIALAHHQNDQAETFLFNVVRGSSLDGMTGIKPSSGAFIHPMLPFNKDEIRNELKDRKQAWRTDQTNEDIRYTRNYIRNRILPDLEQINPLAVSHIYDLTNDLQQIQSLLHRKTEECMEKYVSHRACGSRIRHDILCEDPYIVKMTVKAIIEKEAGCKKDISRIHVQNTVDLFSRAVGKTIDLPYSLCSVRTYEGVSIQRKMEQEKSISELPFLAEKEIDIDGVRIASVFTDQADPFITEKNKYTKCFDYDRIKRNCVFRTRRDGDRMVVHSDGGTKKLKDLLIDCKIPRQTRDSLIVLADGNLVYWVIGVRMAENAKVTSETKKIIRISASGGYTDEF